MLPDNPLQTLSARKVARYRLKPGLIDVLQCYDRFDLLQVVVRKKCSRALTRILSRLFRL